MIYLKKDQTNKVALSLTDNVTITGSTVYFLFDFTNTQTRNNTLFTAADSSTNTSRYNLFDISLTGSAYTNLTAGTISLESGWYNYDVYQMTGQTNLSLTGVTGSKIQTGKVLVTGTTSVNGTQNTYTGTNRSRTVYYKG